MRVYLVIALIIIMIVTHVKNLCRVRYSSNKVVPIVRGSEPTDEAPSPVSPLIPPARVVVDPSLYRNLFKLLQTSTTSDSTNDANLLSYNPYKALEYGKPMTL